MGGMVIRAKLIRRYGNGCMPANRGMKRYMRRNWSPRSKRSSVGATGIKHE